MAVSSLQYDSDTLKTATATFCSGLLIENKWALLRNLLSPDCKFSSQKEARMGEIDCLNSLIGLQNSILQFEKENCSLGRGLKINAKEEKSRLLLVSLNNTMPYRLGFILRWECGVLIHITVVDDPWQGFLDELSASEENRKLNQQSTKTLKKSVGVAHYNWRRISDVVVDAYVTECKNEMRMVRLCNDTNTNTSSSPAEEIKDSEITEVDLSSSKVEKYTLPREKGSTTNTSDDNLLGDLNWDDSSLALIEQEEEECEQDFFEKKKIRFDTTVNALLISERCEIVTDELYYDRADLQTFQFDLNDEVVALQKEHDVNLEVAREICFSGNVSPDIDKLKQSCSEKKSPANSRALIIQRSASTGSAATGSKGSGWYPGKNLPVVRLVRAHKKRQRKKRAKKQGNEACQQPPLIRSSSFSGHEDVEDRITELRASSFGSLLRGRDPEATKYVVAVKVLCCVHLSSRNPSFNKLMTMNSSVRVQVGAECFETPVVPHSSPVFSRTGASFLFSVSLDEAMHGIIFFTIFSTAMSKNVVGAVRVPFVALKTRHDSSLSSRIILPITSNEPNMKSIGKGFYCVSRDDDSSRDGDVPEQGEWSEETAFLKHMYKIDRLSTSSLNYDVAKIPKLYVEIAKVDVSEKEKA